MYPGKRLGIAGACATKRALWNGKPDEHAGQWIGAGELFCGRGSAKASRAEFAKRDDAVCAGITRGVCEKL